MRQCRRILLVAIGALLLACGGAAGEYVLDADAMAERAKESLLGRAAQIVAEGLKPSLDLSPDGEFTLMLKDKIAATGTWERSGGKVTFTSPLLGEATYEDGWLYVTIDDIEVVLRKK